jgi:predicted RNase H-like HicB family nuclease
MTKLTDSLCSQAVTRSESWAKGWHAGQAVSGRVIYSSAKSSAKLQADNQVKVIDPFREAAMKRAVVERLEDGVWFAEIKELPGVWADGRDLGACIDHLRTVIEDWVVLKLRDGDQDLPILDGIDLNSH